MTAEEHMSNTPNTTVPEPERPERYLTSDELSRWLGISPATLCRWRQVGEGPRATWMTPRCPRYLRGDVEAWLRERAA